jgi:hypothetical protein
VFVVFKPSDGRVDVVSNGTCAGDGPVTGSPVVATVAVIPSPGVVDVDPATGGRLKVIDGTDCVVDTSADEDDNNEDSSLTLLVTGIAAVVNGTIGKDGVIETASVGTSSKDVDDESAMLVESSGRTDDGIVVIAVSP